MTIEERYRERYQSGDTPWDVGLPDFNLIEVVTQKPVPSCKVLDIGCGTGDNSIWLAQNHFQVIGTDTLDIALQKAREKASRAHVAEASLFGQHPNAFDIYGNCSYNVLRNQTGISCRGRP